MRVVMLLAVWGGMLAGCSSSASKVPTGTVAPTAASTVASTGRPKAEPTSCPADAPVVDASVSGIPRPLVCGHLVGKFDVQHTASGTFFVDERKGTGAEAQAGKTVTIKFSGYLIDGSLFDSSDQPAEPTKFTLGAGSVINAWDQGLVSMRVGGHRRLGVPPEAAYGVKGGLDGKVPPNASLAYDIELVDVQ